LDITYLFQLLWTSSLNYWSCVCCEARMA